MIALTEESASRRSEERLGSLIRNSSDVVCILDRQAHVTYVSPSVAAAFGHAPETLGGSELAELCYTPTTASACWPSSLRSRASRLANRRRRSSACSHLSQGWREVEALGTNLLSDEAVGGHRAQRPRHLRAQGVPGRARAPGFPRHAHAAAQPRAVPRSRRARARAAAPRPPARGGAVPRRRRLQERQRQPRPRRRRRSAAARWAGVWRTACARSTPRRVSAATSSRS